MGNREGEQSAADLESFTRSASAETYKPITFFEDESLTFKRAASADVSAALTSLRSDRNDTDLFMVAALRQRTCSAVDCVKANPYMKVLCKFNDGTNEVPLFLELLHL